MMSCRQLLITGPSLYVFLLYHENNYMPRICYKLCVTV